MKQIKSLLLAAFAFLSVTAFAQDKSDSIKVYGKCAMCKARIEKGATRLDGVKKADWNVDTKMLTVIYDAQKVKAADIEKGVAAAGHDTERFTATEASYKKLPGCCRYERKSADTKTPSHSAADNHGGHHH